MISIKSKITAKLLNYFFLNPDTTLYVNEISEKLDLDKRNLVKKLKELEEEELLISHERGNLKLYSINKNYPLYNEYKTIILKSIGLESKIKEILKQVKGIKTAYIYGSYAKDSLHIHSDIDLLVIGEHSIASLQRKLNKLQNEIDREINVVNMDEKDFKKRQKNKDPFIEGVLKEKHIKVII